MKKLSLILLALALMVSFAGCSRGGANETTTPTTQAPTTAPTTAPQTRPTTIPTIEPTMDTNIPDPDVDTSMPDDGILPDATDMTDGTNNSDSQTQGRNMRAH